MTTSVPVLDAAAAGAFPELGTRLAAGLAPGWCPPPIRVGVDVVAVAEVAEALALHEDRYLARVFTAHELACCRRGADGGYAAESLAARFAAKEAVVKVLRPEDIRPEWRSIEVRRAEGGWCEVRLAGRAAELATAAGITEVAVSLSHEPAVAAAVAAAWCRSGDEGEG
jgi:holo-[acyl-carrier protein] synthase